MKKFFQILKSRAEVLGIVIIIGLCMISNMDAMKLRKNQEKAQMQIEELKAEKSELRTQNQELKVDKTELQTQIEELKADKTDLRTQIKELKVDKSELQAENEELQTAEKELLKIKKAIKVIEVEKIERDDEEWLTPSYYGELWPEDFYNNKSEAMAHKNLLYTSDIVNSEIALRFMIPPLMFYENWQFVAISPDGKEQVIQKVPPTPPGEGWAVFQFNLKEKGIYIIDLRNLDDSTIHTYFSFVW